MCDAPPFPARSIFGLFTVPAKFYPWVLLVVWQLLVPQVSFLGHLTGLLVRGQAWHDGMALYPGQAAAQSQLCGWPA